MTFPVEMFIMFGVAVLCTSIGLYRYRYLTTVAYGLSMAACSAVLLLLFHKTLAWPLTAACITLMVFGVYLAAHTVRGKGNPSAAHTATGKGNPSAVRTDDMGVRLMLWFGCAALYALMMAPLCYRMIDGSAGDAVAAAGAGHALMAGVGPTVIVGAGLMALGVVMEIAEDASRGFRKRMYPNPFCEIAVWTGVFILGITSFKTPGQWIIAVIGFVGILICRRRLA